MLLFYRERKNKSNLGGRNMATLLIFWWGRGICANNVKRAIGEAQSAPIV